MRSKRLPQRETRIQLGRPAVLVESDGCRIPVLLLDVSRSGFRLQSDAELVIGEMVELQVPRSEPIPAQIQWARGCEAGGRFLD
jgi:hypothetical protein